MNERDAFLRGIATNLYDDTPRLAFADWLDEHGEHDRAEFIRVQCEFEPIRDQYEIPRAAELHEREKHFGSAGTHQYDVARAWLGAMPQGWDDWQKGASIEYRRGFPDTLALPARTFLEFGAKIRELHPTIRRVVLFCINEYGERLAVCPALADLAELELACWYSDADARALARSTHLTELRVLELWLGRTPPLTDGKLCRIIAASKAWPKLRELSLLNPDNKNAKRRKKLAETANTVAGREIAVYRPGYPETFPFAADFWYTFPGYLPDGRMAMADEDHETNPPTLCVITFDKNGKQTKEVIRVPVPDEVVNLPPSVWYEHKDVLKQQLIEVLGFKPGFIRVRDVRFPADRHGAYSPCWHGDVWEEMFGFPDEDTEASWSEWETGNGGACWRHLRNQEWIFGWDRWGDKTGHIHST